VSNPIPGDHPVSLLRTAVFAAFLASGASLGAVTISEIHYDPPGENTGLEFIEIHNDGPTVVDVSGWTFTEGIQCTFPKGTWIPGRGYIVIAVNEAAFRRGSGPEARR